MHPRGIDSGGAAVRFDDFLFDERNATLSKGGAVVKLRPQAFRILGLLLATPGQLVSRDQIRHEIWGDETFVDFNQGLNVCIKQIREALGDDKEATRYVETAPRLGYRFIGSVVPASPPPPAIAHGNTAAADASVLEIPALIAPTLPASITPRAVRVGLVAVAVVIAAFAGWQWVKARSAAATGPIRSLAVLPLQNLSADADQDYFVQGMTDALISDLAQIRSLRVISRSSVMALKDARKSMPQIGAALGVDGIVEGSVRRSGDRVRVSLRLIRAREDRDVWAQVYERSVGNVLELEAEIARAVVVAVRAALTPQERSRLADSRAVDPAVYEAYLKGRYFWNKRDNAGLTKAIEYFKAAIDKDPLYAPAYAGLADCYGLGPGARLPIDELMANARAAATKALELDDSLAEAHSSLGLVHMFYDWDMTAAGQEFRRAIDLNPGYATGHQMYAEWLVLMRQFDQAAAEVRRAHELDPLSLIISRDVGRVAYFAGRFTDAIKDLDRTLETDANFTPARFVRAFALERSGQGDKAVAELEHLVATNGQALMKGALGYAYGSVGNRAAADRIVTELSHPANGRKAPAYDIALVHLGVREDDTALEWLERAASERSYRMVYAGVDPVFDRLRTNPRFVALLKRVGVS